MLLDTHALVWLALEPDSLSSTVSTQIDKALKKNSKPIFICSASFWELALKVRKGCLDLGMSASDFQRRCMETEGLELIDTTATHWIRSAELQWDHKDPIDRILVATSIELNVSLVTCDEAIRRFHPNCVW